jgi:hypothetical protein
MAEALMSSLRRTREAKAALERLAARAAQN